jgi:hypothetical protein
VDRPEVVPLSDVADAFSAADRRYQRILAVDSCLRLHRVDVLD